MIPTSWMRSAVLASGGGLTFAWENETDLKKISKIDQSVYDSSSHRMTKRKGGKKTAPRRQVIWRLWGASTHPVLSSSSSASSPNVWLPLRGQSAQGHFALVFWGFFFAGDTFCPVRGEPKWVTSHCTFALSGGKTKWMKWWRHRWRAHVRKCVGGGANLGTFLCLREWDEYREKYTTVRLKVAVLLSNSIALFIKGNPSLLYVQLFL